MQRKLIEQIKASNISKCNKDAIITSYPVWVARNLSDGRIKKILRYLVDFCAVFDGDLRHPEREELLEAVAEFRLLDYTDNTICDVLKIVKGFLRHCGTPKARAMIELIKTKNIHSKIKASDLITSEEWVLLNNCAEPLYFRAFLELLRWTGFRVSEALSVKKCGIWSSECIICGKKCIVNYARCERSKTKTRYVPFLELAPALFSLAAIKKNPADFVFPVHPVQHYHFLLQKTLKRAGIKKRIWFHLFRHTRYTEWRNKGIDPMTLKRYMGWSPGSNAWMEYEHLTESEYDFLFLKDQV